MGRSNLVFVGKTKSGKEIGGYTGNQAVIPNFTATGWIPGNTTMFMFSLSLEEKYSPRV